MKYLLAVSITFFTFFSFAQEKGVTPIQSTVGSSQSGSTYAVVVGISDYQDEGIPDLRFADKDAEAFAAFLQSPAGGSLDEDHLKVLLNEQATQAQFAGALDWLWEVAQENDRAIIYFSGHGDVEKKSLTQPGFLLCWDAPSRVYMAGGAFPLPMLQEVISTISVQNKSKVIMIADACRSGKLSGSAVNGAQITGSNLAKQYANEIKILSCQPDEYSIEGEQWGGGRGAFSFHLLDGLYGLADGNQDQSVNLLELGRYLEDKVTMEVAPHSQIPMTVGNRGEKLTDVFPDLLMQLKESKKGSLPMFAATEQRGIEDDVLAEADSNIVEMYKAFKESIKHKNFLCAIPGKPACADTYFEKLSKEPQLERLYSSMRRNYAAALQDDAQQAINIWMKADVQELECIGKSLKLEPIPILLERAAELLGKDHYMYNSLIARKLTFEGVLCDSKEEGEEGIRQCLNLFKKSAELESQLPINWHRMGLLYEDLGKTDSAFWCIRKAKDLAPGWALPFADLAYAFNNKEKFTEAKEALEEVNTIDSLHPYVLNQWAVYYTRQPDSISVEKGFKLFEQYRENGGTMYPCWHVNYSRALQDAGKLEKAKAEILKAIEMDSTLAHSWHSLGVILYYSGKFAEAISAFERSTQLDSTDFQSWGAMGNTHIAVGQLEQAIAPLKKSMELEPDFLESWNSLSYVYIRLNRNEEAEPIVLHVLEADSLYLPGWNNLANIYRATDRIPKAEETYQKAIKINPDFPATYVNYCILKINTGELEEALNLLEQSFQKGFRNYNVIHTAGFQKLHDLSGWKKMMDTYFPEKD